MTYSKFLLTLCPFWQLLSMLCLKCCTHFCFKIALLNLILYLLSGTFFQCGKLVCSFSIITFFAKKRDVYSIWEKLWNSFGRNGGRINGWFNLKFKCAKFRNVYRLIYIQSVCEIAARKIMANWNGNEYSKILLWIW